MQITNHLGTDNRGASSPIIIRLKRIPTPLPFYDISSFSDHESPKAGMAITTYNQVVNYVPTTITVYSPSNRAGDLHIAVGCRWFMPLQSCHLSHHILDPPYHTTIPFHTIVIECIITYTKFQEYIVDPPY